MGSGHTLEWIICSSGYLGALQQFMSAHHIVELFSLQYMGYANVAHRAILACFEVSSGVKVCVLQQVT
jgi:hypothetical protein